jgi:hypothetical protein
MIGLVMAGDYTNRGHWGGLGLAAVHIGAEGPQGFLYYYFFILQRLAATSIHRGHGQFIDKCVYNANLQYCSPSNIIGGKAYIVHKPTDAVPQFWLDQFQNTSQTTTAVVSASEPRPDTSAQLVDSPDDDWRSAKSKVHVIHLPGLRSLFVHCNFADRLLLNESANPLDEVVERYGWPSRGRDSPQYTLLVQKPYHWVVDALERRDAEAIGATGAFGQLVRTGAATVKDYLAASTDEMRLNPMTARLASAEKKSVGRNHATRNDLKVAISRIFGLEMLVVLADRPAESLMLLGHELSINVSAASRCEVRRINDTSAWDRETEAKSIVMAVNNRHSLDFNLYLAARRVFRRQYYHAFGVNPSRFEESAAVLNCDPATSEDCTSNGNGGARLTPHLAKTVASGNEVLCVRGCVLQHIPTQTTPLTQDTQ